MADQGEGRALISADSNDGLGAERSRTPPPPAQLKINQKLITARPAATTRAVTCSSLRIQPAPSSSSLPGNPDTR